jgi:hypothetical protein
MHDEFVQTAFVIEKFGPTYEMIIALQKASGGPMDLIGTLEMIRLEMIELGTGTISDKLKTMMRNGPASSSQRLMKQFASVAATMGCHLMMASQCKPRLTAC